MKLTSWCPGHYNPTCSDPCRSLSREQCENGGTCVNAEEKWSCRCQQGYAGTICQVDIDDCVSNPCNSLYSIRCQNLPGRYQCDCKPGYSDVNCDTEIDECAISPCQHSSTCNDHVNGYTCDCDAGYTGVNCQIAARHWMGLTAEDIEGVWKWTDTDTITTFTDWQPGQPNDGRGSNCGLFWMEKDFAWADEPCINRKNQAICEKDRNECISSPCLNGATCINLPGTYNCTCKRDHTGNNCHKNLFSPRDQVCRPGNDNSCYIVFRVTDSWQGAKEFCEARNGHLAVPDDDDEELYIENYLESMKVRYPETVFWIGGRKSGSDRIQWVSGNRITVQRWPTGTSDIVTGTQCMSMDGSYKFQWQAYPCDRQSYFVCEEKVPYPQFVDRNECVSSPCLNGATCIDLPGTYNCTCTRDHADNNCRKNLFSTRDQVCRPGKDYSCYIVFRVTDTWQGAKEFCEARNGNLAVPDDDDEELYIENYLESMKVRYSETVFWIGGRKSGSDRIQWVSGHRITVQRWPAGTSDIVTGTQCMSMDGSYKFQWQAYPCDRQSYFVCEEKVPYPQFVG